MKSNRIILIALLVTGYLGSSMLPVLAQKSDSSKNQCDVKLLEQYEADFDKLVSIQTAQKNSVSAQTTKDMGVVASNYINMNAACFAELYEKGDLVIKQSTHIDNGGLRMLPNSGEIQVSEFRLGGTKWGNNSPFPNGTNAIGPRSAGGVVTYSFIPTGVSHAVEQSADNNLRFSSLPTYSGCFETEITRAFAMWSAVANIQFQRVSDNGAPSNASGTNSDIRIGAHSFDGVSGVLAHAFFPPPNGNTIAGDLHFDRAEPWSCDTSSIDIGIVATHEIGHSIGLNHEEQGALAIMNPFYNANLPSLTSDDIAGVRSIYGPTNTAVLAPEQSNVIVTFLDDMPLVIPFKRRPDECAATIGTNPNVNFVDTWINSCTSESRPFGQFAQFYSFRLSTARNVTINLFSNIDAFLYLLDSRGAVVLFDDDGGSALNSQIQTRLPAGNYTIEATTFSSNQLGSFTLNMQ